MFTKAAQVVFVAILCATPSLIKGDADSDFVKSRLRNDSITNSFVGCRMCTRNESSTKYFEDPNECKNVIECIKKTPKCFQENKELREGHLRVNCDPEKLKAWKCYRYLVTVHSDKILRNNLEGPNVVGLDIIKRMEKVHPCTKEKPKELCEEDIYSCIDEVLEPECKPIMKIDKKFCNNRENQGFPPEEKFFDYALGKTPLPDAATNASFVVSILVSIITKFLINYL